MPVLSICSWLLYQSFSVLFYAVFYSLHRCIDAVLNTCKFSSSALKHTVCIRLFWDVRPYASWVFLFSGPFVEILLWSTLRMVPSKMSRTALIFIHFKGSLLLLWFRIVFSFSWDTLFNFFLLSPHVWWCPLPIFPSTCNLLFLRAFSFSLICSFYSFCQEFFSSFQY